MPKHQKSATKPIKCVLAICLVFVMWIVIGLLPTSARGAPLPPSEIPDSSSASCGSIVRSSDLVNGQFPVCSCTSETWSPLGGGSYCCGKVEGGSCLSTDDSAAPPGSEDVVEEDPDPPPPLNIFEAPNSEDFKTLNPLRIGGSSQARIDQFSSPAGIINRVLEFAFPLAGLILFVMIIWGGFEMIAGATNSKSLQAGKQRITAALIGFMLLFASFWIIQLVEYIFNLAIL